MPVSPIPATQIGAVFVIAMENHNFTQPAAFTAVPQILGNPAAPFINSLVTSGNPNAAQSAFAAHYLSVGSDVHPSEPNYLWAEAGTSFGVKNDNPPFGPGGNNQSTALHLTALLDATGTTWRSYQEDIDLATGGNGRATDTVLPRSEWVSPIVSVTGTNPPGPGNPGYTNPYNGSHQYDYQPKHNPMVFFTDTNGGNDATPANPAAANYAPLQQLQADLAANTVARYNWITPDQFNDMHTPLAGGFTDPRSNTLFTGAAAGIAQGDNFLSIIVPQIMASQAYQDNGAIVIWNDETEGGDGADFTGMEIVISNLAKGNAFASQVVLDHSSDLKSWQELFGAYTPGNALLGAAGAAGVSDLSDLFVAGAIPAANLAIVATDASKPDGSSGSTDFTFTVTRIGDTSAAASASWSVAGTGIRPALASDFVGGVLPGGTVSFAAGQSSQVIAVAVAGDTAEKPDHSFAVSLGAPTIGTGISTPTAAGVIVADQPITDIAGFDNSLNTALDPAPGYYAGPVAGLEKQLILLTPDNVNIAAAGSNWFIHSGAGRDAISVSGGTNVLDGGTGSNFLVGGAGSTDTFFVDARGAAADIWSTVSGFHAGDAATLWGISPDGFALDWVDGEGAPGFTGLTLHATATGAPIASLTLAGFTTTDLGNGRLAVQFGNDPSSGSDYMYIASR